MRLLEVQIQAVPLDRLLSVVGERPGASLREAAAAVREAFAGRSVWNVNSTAAGGGVAEMLQPLLAYARGAGVDARWLVIRGDEEFFKITKRLHHRFHGMAGDGGALGPAERAHYEKVLSVNAAEIRTVLKPHDVLLLHDPQTAGLVPLLRGPNVKVLWRCHIGTELRSTMVDEAWGFVRPYVEVADAVVVSRKQYAPDWLASTVVVIPPSIDPFSVKNQEMTDEVASAILAHEGIIQGESPVRSLCFLRRDGTPGRVDHVADIVRAGPPPTASSRLVVQISRWDPLKDMEGVMHAFAEHVIARDDVHLALVGPNVTSVADDPEGAQVLDRCVAAWRRLPHSARLRVQLVCLPMADIEENAAIVNALQRHATVVVQKSLAEGFGLTVAEAMWKGRPVVASGVGGILDQIVDGESGCLVADPTDLAAVGQAIGRLLDDPALARRLGEGARRRVLEGFLGGRHLVQYARLLLSLEPTAARVRAEHSAQASPPPPP